MLAQFAFVVCLARTLAKVDSANVSGSTLRPFTGVENVNQDTTSLGVVAERLLSTATSSLLRHQQSSTEAPHSVALQSSSPSSSVRKQQQPAAALSCPSGFIKHRGSCYHWVAAIGESKSQQRAGSVVRHNYSTAAAYCSSLGSRLVSIESEAEQLFVERTLSKTDGKAFWTSGRTALADGTWQWESSGQELGYFNWLADYSSWPYEGSHDNSRCLVVDASADYQWMFWPCDNDYYVVGSRRSMRVPIGVICEISRRQGGRSWRRKAKAKQKSDRA